ncbi:hypothetical protein FSZ31_03015 [Sphingorhabdus soli]|uniref:Uncharacterized protein n=1 Tax=Flavisphingopyxis soli TaxID=2601267 RepID=A0A5C6ULI9_9SPHN|nr:hypothetical protein [Sphingorhabdus soli]TXC73719.1 hypothetical protein FSZ31_03015 [Sphingorhabdus soli]
MKHQRLDPAARSRASDASSAASDATAARFIPAIVVPDFTPVPLRARADGWTPARQRGFIAALARCGCVDAAARHVGMARETAYRLRRRRGVQSFVAAWDAIMAEARRRNYRSDRSFDTLWLSALHGRYTPITRNGVEVAVMHSPDNAALLSLYDRAMRGRRVGGAALARSDARPDVRPGTRRPYPHAKGHGERKPPRT